MFFYLIIISLQRSAILMKGKMVLMLLFLAFSSSTVIQAALEPSDGNSADLKFSYCRMKNNNKELQANNQQYFKQIRQVIPLKGDHFLSKMAEFYQATGKDSSNHSFLNDKMGIFKFSALSAVGIVLLLFFTVQFVIGLIFSDAQSPACNKMIEYCLLTITVFGFGLCAAFVLLNSVQGLAHTPEVKEGFDQLMCSNDLWSNFHKVDNRTYSVYQLPDIIEKLETTVFGVRMKLNRLIWHSNNFLQNPRPLKELSDKVKSLSSSNLEAGKDGKSQQLIKSLDGFNLKYQALSKGLGKDTEDDDISHWEIQKKVFSMWESIRTLKISWSYMRVVLKDSVGVSGDLFSEDTQSQFIWWLKIVYTVTAVVTLVSAIGIYFIRLHKSIFLKSALIFVLTTVSLIALVNALMLSAILPYVAWGCEGGNYVLQSEANFVDQIRKGNANDEMSNALKLFSPYNANKLATNLNAGHKDYFMALNKLMEQFLALEASAPQLLADLKNFYAKYADKPQDRDKIDKVKSGLSQNSFDGLRVLHAQVQSLIGLIDPQTGAFGSLAPSRVGSVFKNNVNAMCVANFNNLFEIRKRMNQIGYGLFFVLVFLSIVRITQPAAPVFKLDDLQESKIVVLKEGTETDLSAKRPQTPSVEDD